MSQAQAPGLVQGDWMEIRERLQREITTLCSLLPVAGKVPMLPSLAEERDDGFLLLMLLAEFARTYTRHFDREKVMRILNEEHGLEALLSGNHHHLNYLGQVYLD